MVNALGGMVGSAVGAALGMQSGTSLQDFLSHFSSSDGVWAKTIDPYASFDVTMKFYPTVSYEEDEGDWKKRLGASLESSAKSAVKNLANNVTGGLLGSIMNNQSSVMDRHDSNDDANGGEDTFMEYLAAANMFVGQQDWVGEKAGEAVKPLELQLGLYCQEVTLPNFEIPGVGSSPTAIGEFPINGTILKADTNVLTMKIVNTKASLHERLFYPWMREVVSPMWHYNSQPYTTATVTVDLTKHNSVKYVFCGCRPQKIMMQQATQEADARNLTRDVSFLFDYMFVTSDLKVSETLAEKLLSSGKTLLNSASKMVQF